MGYSSVQSVDSSARGVHDLQGKLKALEKDNRLLGFAYIRSCRDRDALARRAMFLEDRLEFQETQFQKLLLNKAGIPQDMLQKNVELANRNEALDQKLQKVINEKREVCIRQSFEAFLQRDHALLKPDTSSNATSKSDRSYPTDVRLGDHFGKQSRSKVRRQPVASDMLTRNKDKKDDKEDTKNEVSKSINASLPSTVTNKDQVQKNAGGHDNSTNVATRENALPVNEESNDAVLVPNPIAIISSGNATSVMEGVTEIESTLQLVDMASTQSPSDDVKTTAAPEVKLASPLFTTTEFKLLAQPKSSPWRDADFFLEEAGDKTKNISSTGSTDIVASGATGDLMMGSRDLLPSEEILETSESNEVFGSSEDSSQSFSKSRSGVSSSSGSSSSATGNNSSSSYFDKSHLSSGHMSSPMHVPGVGPRPINMQGDDQNLPPWASPDYVKQVLAESSTTTSVNSNSQNPKISKPRALVSSTLTTAGPVMPHTSPGLSDKNSSYLIKSGSHLGTHPRVSAVLLQTPRGNNEIQQTTQAYAISEQILASPQEPPSSMILEAADHQALVSPQLYAPPHNMSPEEDTPDRRGNNCQQQ